MWQAYIEKKKKKEVYKNVMCHKFCFPLVDKILLILSLRSPYK